MNEKIIGIMGGMGPEATADLFMKIIKATKVEKDQDHLRIIIDNNPKIPDRTEAILKGGEDPLPLMKSTLENLLTAGADLIAIPCNTAHYYHAALQEKCPVSILNMLAECAREAQNEMGLDACLGLLASSGTIETAIYHNEFKKYGIELMVPEGSSQEKVMRAIYGVKAGENPGELRELLLQVVEEMKEKGVNGIILGCTELPLLIKQGDLPLDVFDPTEILAKSAVSFAKNGINGNRTGTKQEKNIN